jgi:integrase
LKGGVFLDNPEKLRFSSGYRRPPDMPRPPVDIPKYSIHKRSGQAYVTLSGRQVYLGRHNTPESKSRYREAVRQHLAGIGPAAAAADNGSPNAVHPAAGGGGGTPTVSTVIAAFWQSQQSYYGADSRELFNYRDALRPLRELFGASPAAAFGPRNLKAVVEEMIHLGWCRTTINRHLSRVKSLFKWAASEELIPPTIYHGLISVSGLRKGRSPAREPDPVRPVPPEIVDATLTKLSPQVRAMVELQLLTGMRPGEVCAMRCGEVDTSAQPWRYRPSAHKTAHHGHDRIVHLGPRAQAVLAPYLTAEAQSQVFRPTDAEAVRHARLRDGRQTPLTPSQRARSSAARARPRRRPPGDRYTVASYRRAIARACELAFPPPPELRPTPASDGGPGESRANFLKRLTQEQKSALKKWHDEHGWHPHQLRHTAATRLRREFGLDAAKAILGHRTVTVTQFYAEQDERLAETVARQVG